MVAFSSLAAGTAQLMFRTTMSILRSDKEAIIRFWGDTYNSCNVMVITILLGLRQHLSESVIDTKVRVFTQDTIKIYFKKLP